MCFERAKVAIFDEETSIVEQVERFRSVAREVDDEQFFGSWWA